MNALRPSPSGEAQMELTVQNVYGLLLRSKLLAVDEARALYSRWQDEAKDAANNINRFAAWMVSNRYVTEYQASLLVRGHGDGFFLGDYKVLDRIGKGRMAGVFKAQHRLGQPVAIKVLPPSKAREANFQRRFKREARLLLRLKHPNIVRAFQVSETAGLHYLVMEYLEGETLDEVMQRRRAKFLPAEAVRLIHQTLQGLHHIHEQGLVHRDLKPANVMLVAGSGSTPDSTLRSTVKILDIGLGRALFDDRVSEKSVDGSLTSEGVLLGTPDYMAPEQARDARAADIRADIYSVGCVLYHLLTGQLPFPDTNIISQMIRHATEAARPVKELNPAIPEGLQQVVSQMMAKDPAQRYPTPERAAQALQAFLPGGAEQFAMPESDPGMRPFLQWLEGEDKRTDKLPPAPPPPPPTKTGLGRAADRVEKRAQLRASLVTKIKAKMRERMQAEIARRLNKAGVKPDTKAEPHNAAGEKRKSREKKKNPPPLATPVAPPMAMPVGRPTASPTPVSGNVPKIDVELVTMAPVQSALRLSRRDLVFGGIGILAGAAAAAVGFIVAYRTK
jgi:serine/threonine protein kinase